MTIFFSVHFSKNVPIQTENFNNFYSFTQIKITGEGYQLIKTYLHVIPCTILCYDLSIFYNSA